MLDAIDASVVPKFEISVVICTHNRDQLLRQAIQSLVDQDFRKSDYEVLVVDNASADATHQVVQSFRGTTNIRYIHERRLGLNIARNTGWTAADGKYVAYMDDDAIANPGWLGAIREGFDSDPKVGIVGGPADPIWQSHRPSWLCDHLLKTLSIIDLGSSKRMVENIEKEWFIGANMAVPKAVLQDVDGFHPMLDRSGTKLLSNGDLYLQKEVARLGYRRLYVPSMAIGHLVPASRLSRTWFLRRFFWQGVSDAAMRSIEDPALRNRRVELIVIEIGRLILQPLKFCYRSLSAKRPRAFAFVCWMFTRVGFAVGLLQVPPRRTRAEIRSGG